MLSRIDGVTADIVTMQARIETQLGELAPAVARLDAIPGIGPIAAPMILAEIDTDMGRFLRRRIRPPGRSWPPG